MRGVRIFARALSDTLEHLLPYTLASLAWWAGLFTIVFSPTLTLALLRVADPRVTSETERPGIREGLRLPPSDRRRAWLLALIWVPVIVILSANLLTYQAQEGRFALLVPAWSVLFVAAVIVGGAAFGIVALFDDSPLAAIKVAAALVFGRPARSIPVAIGVLVTLIVGTLLVVPLFMFVPALIAAAFNRFVLDGLGIPVIDPLTPSEERLHEEARERAARRLGP